MIRQFGSILKRARFSTVPKVNDQKVNVTFVDDVTGKRTSLVGLVGQTLVDVCRLYKFDLLDSDFDPHLSKPASKKMSDIWVDDQWGEGPQSAISHVYFSDDWFEKITPPLDSEIKILNMDLPPGDPKPTSRLGTEVKLTKDMDGIVVYVPDGR